MLYLKQSTASQAVLIGPFVDDTDGKTAETGLTIANTDIRLSANGGNMFSKTSGGGTHDEAGWYTITLDATDTATVGRLQISTDVSGALPTWAEFQVVEEPVYVNMFAASAVGPLTAAQVKSEADTALADIKLDHLIAVADGDDPVNGSIIAEMVSSTGDWSTFTAAASFQALQGLINAVKTAVVTNAAGVDIAADIIALKAETVLIVADSGELQTDWANGGRLDLLIDAIPTTAMRGTDGALTDKAGFSLSTAGILAIWHQALSAIATSGSVGKLLKDEITSVRMATLTDWINGGRLDNLLDAIPTTAMRGTDGALTDKAGFSLSTAGILAIWHQAVSAIVTASTIGKLLKDEITSVRMAALTDWINGGRLDNLLDAIPTTAEFETRTLAAAPLAQLTQNLDNCMAGTASGTPTTTTMVSDIGVTVDDQFKGRIITFDDDTTTAALRNQSTDITGTTASSNTLTFTELTTAPVSDDTFVIT